MKTQYSDSDPHKRIGWETLDSIGVGKKKYPVSGEVTDIQVYWSSSQKKFIGTTAHRYLLIVYISQTRKCLIVIVQVVLVFKRFNYWPPIIDILKTTLPVQSMALITLRGHLAKGETKWGHRLTNKNTSYPTEGLVRTQLKKDFGQGLVQWHSESVYRRQTV